MIKFIYKLNQEAYAKMEHIYDKIAVFLFCTAFYVTDISNGVNIKIVPILMAIIFSAAYSYFDYKGLKAVLATVFTAICIFMPEYVYFIPLVVYDTVLEKSWLWIPVAVAAIINFVNVPLLIFITVVAFSLVAVLLKYRSKTLRKAKHQLYELRDNSKEMAMKLEESNKELIEKQDNEITLATLNERNRIARDIHDNVGHMLSSSILQIGAMIATGKDEAEKEKLRQLNKTLSSAMDSIRTSVHDLHNEALDMHSEIQKLIDSFTFCKAELDYDIQSNPDKKLKYCFISIIKESLANIIKHSNATYVSVRLHEHPALYQLIIQDNGTLVSKEQSSGIGLANISDRVAAFKGNLNIRTEKGFRIFISIPKE
jgi:signal transduction histidine kinase